MASNEGIKKVIDPNFIAQLAEAIQNGNGSKKRLVGNHPRGFWRGEREPLSVVDAFGEYIMNVIDLSTIDPRCHGREINMFMNAIEKPKNTVVELNIRDDGPGFSTGPDQFMDVFMEFMGINKTNNGNKTIGEAGIGAKIASAYLAKRHHYSWSAGGGEPICHWIADKDDWNNWDDWKYTQDEYDGPSFFNINLSKLNFSSSGHINPAKLRDQLAEKFAGCLERHPNIKIHTCRPDAQRKTAPLAVPEPLNYLKDYYWKGTVYWSGLPAEVSVGLLDGSDGLFYNNASVRISRSGVMHFEQKESKAHPLLLTKDDGNPMVYQGQLYFRNTLITIDSPAFESTPIKNDLLWGNDKNKKILHNIGVHPEFREMLKKIIKHNNTKDIKSEKNVSHSYQKRLEKLEIAAATDINNILSNTDVTNVEYPFKQTKNGNPNPKKQKRVSRTPKKQKKGDTPNNKKQPTVNIGGQDLKFKVEWVEEAPGSEHLRSWIEKTDDSIIVNVNKSYVGYTDKIDRDEKKESVYLADTIGYIWQDYRLELLLNESNSINSDELMTIQRERDDAIARYMPIIIG
jgi:hypothetical protein